MSKNFGNKEKSVRKFVFTFLVAIAATVSASNVYGQPGGNNFFQTVGGIRISPHGILEQTNGQFRSKLRLQMQQELNREIDPAVAAKSDLRMISVKGIEAALRKANETGEELPDEIKFMAGIQRLEYVFVYPEKGDIVLAGKGEGWKVDEMGNVVGKTTGAPVIRLEDFLTAMQTADNARKDYGISVSINPTEEGLRRLKRVFRQIGSGFNSRSVSRIEDAMGPNEISLTGVPTDSRFANVLVAADHHMKRLAMGFEEAAVKGMPSVLQMAKKRRKVPSITPRFWLECAYEPVKKSDDGLSWQISGPGAKALTEEESLLQPDGKARKSHPIATQWAESMTEQFEELANEDVIFAELRNILDMSVIAALIQKEAMMSAVNLDAPFLTGAKEIELPKWQTPKTVPAQCSYCSVGSRGNKSYMITVSGGIQVDSWGVLDSIEVDNSISETRTLAASNPSSTSAYWNGN